MWTTPRCAAGFDNSGACILGNVAGPLAEIDLTANGDPRKNREAREAVTLGGIQLGSPGADVTDRYKISETTQDLCSGGGHRGLVESGCGGVGRAVASG